MNSMPDVTCDPSQFFHVQMKQFAGFLALVPVGRLGGIEQPQAMKASAFQSSSDRGRRHAEPTGNLRAGLTGAAKLKDQLLALG
jgi:hypothetical protein